MDIQNQVCGQPTRVMEIEYYCCLWVLFHNKLICLLQILQRCSYPYSSTFQLTSRSGRTEEDLSSLISYLDKAEGEGLGVW